MTHAGTLLTVLTFVLTTGHVLPSAPRHVVPLRPAATTSPATFDVTVHAPTPELEDLVASAVGRFAAAGLELPPVDVFFHQDRLPCRGGDGLHTPGPGISRVDMCVRGLAWEMPTLLHELAHAWMWANFPAEQRPAFLALRGLDVWHDQHTAWNLQGTEHAAEILAWGVGERMRLPGELPHHDLASVTAAYRFLTGRAPISETVIEEPVVPTRRGGPEA